MKKKKKNYDSFYGIAYFPSQVITHDCSYSGHQINNHSSESSKSLKYDPYEYAMYMHHLFMAHKEPRFC